ncbi:S-adenosyl methyltransferase [Pseudonocardia thermophila]|uniref:S-adenosyl methyltransferase n=1 Tax=Pseudonocardia thermophila TaxID=1848 RepID=A0A1M6R2I3_PSETH|nr:SAM-dependent methyltransferase [Pseudonocardia thermophila]SHK26600.1 S-adenosyl methyltransferase [Pseudonocardia thermophila]
MSEPVDLQTDVPHGARIWNYWLGGKDNYAADREIGDAVAAAVPFVRQYALLTRQFLIRAVTYLAAEAGIRQFLDVGTGLPTAQNTHEVAQAVAPDAKIVYVDNDPLVLAHARALLAGTTSEGITTYVDADYREPEKVLAGARETLDFSQPVAVLFMGVFGYVEADEMHRVVREIVGATCSGSYLAMWDGTSTSEVAIAGAKAQADMGSPYRLSTVDELEECFKGLEMVEPGLVPVTLWRPAPAAIGAPEPIDAYGGVGRKP